MNVKGWIRNLGSGAVEAHLEGEEDNVERLVTWMHMGPPLARVERVDDSDAEAQSYTTFDVRRS
jgi:acylphosphatase